ncbi:glycosyltransferase [Paenibacillus turpanensis]|uniref:glycosyltransferase n=1 Tax=Paenibacillus turpanensis TaxID=2689078 RepID=UPI00140999CE|nr:glycosyltransferase [Paenibacillus turpanensis]
MSTVIIFRDLLLPPSETFIREQGERLTQFSPLYVGLRNDKGISLPKEKTYIVNDGSTYGKMKQIAFKAIQADLGIAKTLKRHKPRLIHAHFGPDGLTVLPLAEKLSIPLLVTFHGYDATVYDEYALKSKIFSHRNYAKKKNQLQASKARYIAVSHFIKQKMVESGFDPEHIIQHYIGIDIDKFTPIPDVPREDIVLFVGRLVEKKGCSYLISAMAEVQQRCPDVELIVIGDGPLRSELELEAKNKLKKFRFLGFQPPKEIKAWMNKAKLFSVPSIIAENGDAEGFGMVFAEANAMGVPVVSFKTGGIPEAVLDGETALLAEEKDDKQLAEHIHYLLTDQEAWKRFSDNGYRRVRDLFDIRQQTAKLEQIYEETIAGGYTPAQR